MMNTTKNETYRHNATDNLEKAEKMIKTLIYNGRPTEKALEICKWLLSFNSEESYAIKCYQTGVLSNRPDIRFCIDRGEDCLPGKKIRTNFLVIEPNFEIMGLYSSTPDSISYFHSEQNNSRRRRINSSDTLSLSMEKLKKHILESYCIKIKALNLVSVVCNS